MSEQGLTRPRQVTIAVGMGLFGCFIFVIALIDAMGATYSLAARNAIKDIIGQPPYDGMGLTVEEILRVIRVVIYGMGAAAAVGFVLSFYTLQRNNAARIAFTAAAVCLLPGLLGPEMVGISAILVAFAAIGLWSAPARDWFAGRVPRPAAPSVPRPPATRGLSQTQPPPSAVPFGTPPPPPPTAPGAWPAPSPADLASYAPPGAVRARPRALDTAVTLTRVFTIVSGLVLVAATVFLAVSRADYEAEARSTLDSSSMFRDLAVTPHQVWVVVLVSLAMMVLWCGATFALTFFVVRRAAWARILLIVSAAGSAMVSLLGILAIVPVVTLGASVATIYLLLRREVSDWFSDRPSRLPTRPW